MKTKKSVYLSIIFVLVIITALILLASKYNLINNKNSPVTIEPNGEVTEITQASPVKTLSYEFQEIATNLDVPWSVVFTNRNRMLVTERPGRIIEIKDGVKNPSPLFEFNETKTIDETGLMGMTLDPDYTQNKYLYLCVTYQTAKTLFSKVTRLTDNGGFLSEQTDLLKGIPAAKYHAGCELSFGPDKKLYISTGDALDKDQAQNKNSLSGKILRLNTDGSVPSDNPNPNSPIWSYGHRNPQGLDFDKNGRLYSSEHGPTLIDGPAGGDEINLIVKDGNYGWPKVSHEKRLEGTIPPLLLYTPAVAPASLIVYKGNKYPGWENNIFFAGLKGEGLWRLELSKDGNSIATSTQIPEVKFGRIREVTTDPDGYIYFTTSNRDNRGNPSKTDDKIYKIIPILK